MSDERDKVSEIRNNLHKITSPNEKLDKIISQTDSLSRGRQVINAKQAFMMTPHQLNITNFSPIIGVV